MSAAVPRSQQQHSSLSGDGTMHHTGTAVLPSSAISHTFLEQLQLPLKQVLQLPRRCLAVAALHACDHPACLVWLAWSASFAAALLQGAVAAVPSALNEGSRTGSSRQCQHIQQQH